VVGLAQFIAYIANKESWKPARDQSYSPKGLTAPCPKNTFKPSNSALDHMWPPGRRQQLATYGGKLHNLDVSLIGIHFRIWMLYIERTMISTYTIGGFSYPALFC
jgi:hypothetical protein